MILQNIKRRWVAILCLIAVMCITCALAACSEAFDPFDVGNTATVIYDANGGRFSSADKTGIRTFRYKPGTTIMEPSDAVAEEEEDKDDDADSDTDTDTDQTPGEGSEGEEGDTDKEEGQTASSGINLPSLMYYHVTGWYPAVLDENDQPLKDGDEFVDENGVSIFEGEPWDFSQKLPQEDYSYLYLVAHWTENYSFTIDVGKEAAAAGVENHVDRNYTTPSNVIAPVRAPEWSGHTVRYFVYNANGQEQHIYSLSELGDLRLDDSNPHITVTIEWLTGDWKVVSKAADLASIDSDANYWIDKDIDMDGNSFTFSGYSGEFNGNGHTISNFRTQDRDRSAVAYSQFGFTDGGYLHDIVFKDATYSVTYIQRINLPNYYTVGFISADGSSYDLSKFTNIVFDGCSLTVIKSSTLVAEVVYGSGEYEGIFGELGVGQTFVPGEGSTPIEVTIVQQ